MKPSEKDSTPTGDAESVETPIVVKSTFWHKAATLCLWSPLIAILCMPVCRPQPVDLSHGAYYAQVQMQANMLTAAFIPAVGILSGLLALCGIARVGAKGLLWKALIGLAIWALFFVTALPAYLSAK
jgi:hypothetical protein